MTDEILKKGQNMSKEIHRLETIIFAIQNYRLNSPVIKLPKKKKACFTYGRKQEYTETIWLEEDDLVYIEEIAKKKVTQLKEEYEKLGKEDNK